MAHVAARTSQSLADENAFDRFEAEFIETLTGGANLAQAQVGGLNARTASHENSTLDRVVEFPHVARPAVLEHGLQGAGLEAGRSLAIAGSVAGKKVPGEQWKIFAAIAQRRKMNFHGVEAEEQIFAKASRGTLLMQ